ncbi:DNA adenine methyltransferase from phage origin [Enterobacter sp. FY-07]|uniref:DNA-methyltransferase n=1 Tax=Kosakonia oryzendophytica TaxID=1005665 RepID=UPI000777EF5D|nr:site-specific DNA-methyltransferase [Kosakonia oryzendophytica]AMO48874.1 DNA adenine methyltransferase from phage origin [Enterobacter sp. FY-07]WBT56621.1 site-specific DNA-methyltransferase [Kosakonia oryzendophytica]
MKNTVKISSAHLINDDCLRFVQTLPDNSVDLIVTDPPYFRVKPNGWDNQWRGDEDYLKWLDSCLAQFWRVLKPAGSIYLFCGHRLAAETEVMLKTRFNLLNHIIWAKPSGRWNGCHKESLRSYFPATERILFAEHYLGPYRPKDDGYERKGAEIKQSLMAPLIEYFQHARASLGVTSKEIADATGKKNMVSHWFGSSQWHLPGEADYQKLQDLFDRIAYDKHQGSELIQPHHQLVATYHSLNRKYVELLEEYKVLRRYFAVTAAVPYTDVWMHKPVQFYPGKHPCEKPADMLRQIISASSRPGDLVADFFMGSGSTIKEAVALGRRAIGVELETARFEQTVAEISEQSGTEAK